MHQDFQPKADMDRELSKTPALKAELEISDAVASWEKNEDLARLVEALTLSDYPLMYLESFVLKHAQEHPDEEEINTNGFTYHEMPGIPYLELILDQNKQVIGARRKTPKMVS